MKIAMIKIAICLAIGALGGFVLSRAYLAQADAYHSAARNASSEALDEP